MEKKTDKAMLFVILTLILIWTPIMTPVHEMGHFLATYMVGGHAEIVAYNLTMCYGVYPIFDGFVSAMGEGFIGICFALLFVALKKPHLGVMTKTALITLPVEFITLTDHENSPTAFIWLIGIMVLCWRVAFGPFRKKKNSRTEVPRQKRSPSVR